ncbi:FlgB family protein [Marimonas arenosa]|uniref:FlgB family protein n=1 Tax=Marimonas arenosa TaxID=1795305 RepID=A0AAE3WDD0_9RHOB|nr:FlgB family protein [Marimonas arenosa]MDQ2090554.1 FlgB family protein [Marimonas arenosa]
MHDKIEIFRVAAAMARHAGTRQALVAQNIANADTPGYKARDVVPFAELVSRDTGGFYTRATRAGHLNGRDGSLRPEIVAAKDALANPNDNQVTLEAEMLKAVAVKRQHDRALAIYRSGLNILRTSLGRGA